MFPTMTDVAEEWRKHVKTMKASDDVTVRRVGDGLEQIFRALDEDPRPAEEVWAAIEQEVNA